MRLVTIIVVLVALTTSCTETQHLGGASSCVDFIHSDMAQRGDAVAAAAAANARLVPSDAAVPDVADVSMMCDAYPDITVAEAMGRVVERS